MLPCYYGDERAEFRYDFYCSLCRATKLFQWLQSRVIMDMIRLFIKKRLPCHKCLLSSFPGESTAVIWEVNISHSVAEIPVIYIFESSVKQRKQMFTLSYKESFVPVAYFCKMFELMNIVGDFYGLLDIQSYAVISAGLGWINLAYYCSGHWLKEVHGQKENSAAYLSPMLLIWGADGGNLSKNESQRIMLNLESMEV